MADITNIPEIDTALNDVLPALSRERWITIAAIVALAVLCALGARWALTSENPRFAFAAGIGFVFGVGQMLRWLRRGHERKVMPILARTIGLQFNKDPGPYRERLPRGLLPARGREVCEDHVSGSFAGGSIEAVEVHIETGGKHSVTLFNGMVIWVTNAGPEVSLNIAQPTQTSAGFMTGPLLEMAGKVRHGNFPYRGGSMEFWGPGGQRIPTAQLNAYASALVRAGFAFPAGGEVYSAARTAKQSYLALSYKRTKFVFGGIIAPKHLMQEQIQNAFADLNGVLKVGSAMIAAEAELSPASGSSELDSKA